MMNIFYFQTEFAHFVQNQYGVAKSRSFASLSAIFVSFDVILRWENVLNRQKSTQMVSVNWFHSGSSQPQMDSSAMKEKMLTRKSSSFQNNNFKAGYMPVENMKPEMKGRKTFAFWTLLILLFLLVIGNLILTITIIGVLKLGQGECYLN